MIPSHHSPLRSIARGWLAFAQLLGTVQMVVVLTVLYWVCVPFLFIRYGLISDPLGLRRTRKSGWRECEDPDDVMEHMRRQW